ncbi:hypothetical protein BV900_27945 [Agrobacterium tumefaciens]|nr:hypothetical protein BV900_27945 [Agrobacterium tumefaciens]
MHQTRAKRPFVVVIKSSRRRARRQEASFLWKNVDLAAAMQLVIRDMDDDSASVAETSNEKNQNKF